MATKPENTATFSVRLTEDQRHLLAALAKHQDTTTASLARQFVLEGIKRALDPEEIERRMEAEKQRLLQAAFEMQSSVQSNTDTDKS